MRPLRTFVLGLLAGVLVQWLIDYFYWQRRRAEGMYIIETVPESRPASVEDPKPQPAVKAAPDNLKVIKGIGPVIERKLNDAGIYTFEQLGNLTAADLRNILGNVIQRLADEDTLLQQARDLARQK